MTMRLSKSNHQVLTSDRVQDPPWQAQAPVVHFSPVNTPPTVDSTVLFPHQHRPLIMFEMSVVEHVLVLDLIIQGMFEHRETLLISFHHNKGEIL